MSSSSKDYRRGILCMSLAMMLFLINDSMVKLVTARAPADQIIFCRGAFVAGFILVWLAAARPHVFRYLAHPGMIRAGQRGMLDAVSSFSFVGSLFFLPLPNATAINLSGPLILTTLAILFLGEKVAWRHYAAILVGLFGVVLIIQPSGEAFNWFSLLALLSTFFTATRDAVTRRIGFEMPSILLTLATGVVTSAIAGLLGLAGLAGWGRAWPPISVGDVALLALASLFMIAAQQLTIYSLRVAQASTVAPFRYTSMLWAMFYGYLLWGDVPNLVALAGMVVVVLSGLYLLHRERLKHRIAEVAP